MGSTPEANDELLGRQLGSWILTAKLGEGGMGAVYLAQHVLLPGRTAAIKVLLPEVMRSAEVQKRFVREAQTAASLEHPNIIHIGDLSEQGGRYYFVMPALAGCSLEDLCRQRGPLPVALTLHLAAQLFSALWAAHQAGVVHRDLKPQNVFVTPTDDGQRHHVTVLDFGLAKLVEGSGLAAGAQTRTNQVFGTPGYMAPEQTRGARDVDHRADIYAVGVMLYRMLVGSVPFTGETFGEIYHQQLIERPKDPREARPDLPEELARVILAALDPDPKNRPQTTFDFAWALIRATPGGEDIARAVAPLLFDQSPAAARTIRVQAPLALPGEPPTLSLGPAAPRTTPLAGARPTDPAAHTDAPGRRWWLWPLVLGATLAVATPIVLVAVGRSRDTSDDSTVTGADVEHDAGKAGATATGGKPAAFVPDAAPAPTRGPGADAATPVPVVPVVVDGGAPGPGPKSPPPPPVDRSGSGTLTVRVKPWADVHIDGKFAATTPLTRELKVGPHVVRLVNESAGRTETVRIRIERGKSRLIQRDWEKK